VNIPFLDLKAQYQTIREQVLSSIEQVLESSEFILGPNVSVFEQEVAKYLGVKHAIGVGNGTDALVLILDALGIGPGDEVITTPMTFCSTVNVIEQVGARPVLVDVEPDTLNIDPDKVEDAVTTKTKAIMPVHYSGHPVDLDAIYDIAERHNLFVVEDAAHAVSAKYKGRYIGTVEPLQHLASTPLRT